MTEYYSQYYTVPRSRSYSKCGVVIEYSYRVSIDLIIEESAVRHRQLQQMSCR